MTGNPADGNTSEASLAEGETSLPPPAPAAAAAAAGTTTAAASSLLDAARRPRVEDSSCDDETDEKPVRQRRRPLDQENNNDDDDDDDSCYEGDNDNDNLLVMNRKDGCESEGTVGEEPTHHSDGSMEVGEARGVEDAVHHRQPQHTQQKQQRHHNRRGSLPSPSLLPSSPSRGGLASSEEESVAELEDVNEEVSVAELSEGECSCSSIETTARDEEEEPIPPPSNNKIACMPSSASDPAPTSPTAALPPKPSSICSLASSNGTNIKNNNSTPKQQQQLYPHKPTIKTTSSSSSSSSSSMSKANHNSNTHNHRAEVSFSSNPQVGEAAKYSSNETRIATTNSHREGQRRGADNSIRNNHSHIHSHKNASTSPSSSSSLPPNLLRAFQVPAPATNTTASKSASPSVSVSAKRSPELEAGLKSTTNTDAAASTAPTAYETQQYLHPQVSSSSSLGRTQSGQYTQRNNNSNNNDDQEEDEDHSPMSLPKFPNPENCMWTSTHAANCPSEDRSSSLVNVLLQPLPPNFDSETQLPPLEPDYKTLIRLSLWSVIDGHGGGCVATYASEVLLPHIAASISRALGCAIVDRGVCTVNGQLRDANALDLDGLIKTSDQGLLGKPNSIRYRSPFERSDCEDEEEGLVDDDVVTMADNGTTPPSLKAPIRRGRSSPPATDEEDYNPSSDNNEDASRAASKTPPMKRAPGSGSVRSVKTSVNTTASPNHLEEAQLGTHSPREVAAITRAITESFLAVDEGWINAIDPVATHQTSCQSNGRWNSGACALVVFTVQRLDWTAVSGNEPDDRGRRRGGPEKSRVHDTSLNRDAARRRMLDFAARAKSASSLSTVSSTSSLTTEEAVNASGLESEITETEGEDDEDQPNSRADVRRRYTARKATEASSNIPKESLIGAPGGCSCHCYRAHEAILYTAHVGDCRAVMLGSAPPRTIKVRDSFADHPDTTDDESSHHSSDETECLSSSDHDADSSDENDIMEVENMSAGSKSSRKQPATTPNTVSSSATSTTPSYMTYMRRPARRSRRRNADDMGPNAPYIALPPLEADVASPSRTIEVDIRDMERRNRRKQQQIERNGGTGTGTGSIAAAGDGTGSNSGSGGGSGKDPSDSSTTSQESEEQMRLIHLPPVTRPIDLTTDHSAYNPAEVTAVLRRCNNAPRAISAGVGGGIKRVAGSLAVTRALGDAYLKTPLLSFLPYKSHAPYITARPEVNCRPVSSTTDKVLILATDGVWERASGEDALRWVRNFYAERIAEAERRNNRRSNKDSSASDLPASVILSPNNGNNASALMLGSINGNNSNGNTTLVKGSLEAEQERQDDQSQNLDLMCLERRSCSRKRGIDNIMPRSPSPPSSKRRKIGCRGSNAVQCGWSRNSNVADVIVRRVLNKVRRARNISSLHALMSLPQGRARRSKHDDITACVIDLSAFVS